MQWFMYVRVLKIYLNDQIIVVRKSRTLEDCDRLMQSDNSCFDLSGDALVLGDWLLPALGEGRCWQFGVLTAREFGLLLSCWCAILIAHQIVMAKHGGSCVHFSGISTCGRTSRETVSHPQRQPLPTPYKTVYVIVTNTRLQPLTRTFYNSMLVSFSLLKI